MIKKPVNWDKPIQTESGLRATYVFKLRDDKYPRLVVVHDERADVFMSYPEDGTMTSSLNIINVPERQKAFIVIYLPRESLPMAIYCGNSERLKNVLKECTTVIAVKEIEYSKGEGVRKWDV